VERRFAWLSRYRRLNIVYDRATDLFAGHISIAMISIMARRLVAQTQAQQGLNRVQLLTFFYSNTKVIALVNDALDAPGWANSSYTGDAGIEAVRNLLAAQNELELFG
jgi:hypothetical protein